MTATQYTITWAMRQKEVLHCRVLVLLGLLLFDIIESDAKPRFNASHHFQWIIVWQWNCKIETEA